MKNDEKSPVNEWNYAADRLGFLTGGPLDSLVEHLARGGAAPPVVTAEMPVSHPEGGAPSINSELTNNV